MKTYSFINVKTRVKFNLPLVAPGVVLLNGRRWDIAALKMIGIHESPDYQPARLVGSLRFLDGTQYKGFTTTQFSRRKQPR